ncbi:MAG TPA: hypothetical protein PKA09_12685, partial [Geminicoccus sp.]|nr:hypothetical protein [Geminicoccus sp.]
MRRITVGVGACEYPGGVVTVRTALTAGASALVAVAVVAAGLRPGLLTVAVVVVAAAAVVTVLCLAAVDAAACGVVDAVEADVEVCGPRLAVGLGPDAVALVAELAPGPAFFFFVGFICGFGGAGPGWSSTRREIAAQDSVEVGAEVDVAAGVEVDDVAEACVAALGLIEYVGLRGVALLDSGGVGSALAGAPSRGIPSSSYLGISGAGSGAGPAAPLLIIASAGSERPTATTVVTSKTANNRGRGMRFPFIRGRKSHAH